MNDLKIHDIKPLVEVPDYSIYLFIALILAFIIGLLFVSYFFYQKIKNAKKNNQKMYIRKIKNIDLSASKMAAYEITKYTLLILKNENQTTLSKELLKDLNQYKYKKEVQPFNESTILLYKKLTETL